MSVNAYLAGPERRILESARIGIAGAGGLGSNCAMHLVRAGVRKLTVVDFDVVSESNLNRQFFFRDQVGEKKVEALRANLFRIEPDLELRAVDLKLTGENAKATFADCDVVVEALDAAEAKSMLLAALLPLGRPLVSAAGLAGWGRSAAIAPRKVGRNLILIGDGESDVSRGLAPESPRVGIAAAMEANAVVATLLGQPV